MREYRHGTAVTRVSRLVLALNGVDAGTTLVLVRLGLASELNPVLAPLLSFSPALFLVAKLVVVDTLVVWLAGKPESAVARVGLEVALLGYGAALVWQLLHL